MVKEPHNRKELASPKSQVKRKDRVKEEMTQRLPLGEWLRANPSMRPRKKAE